MSQYLIDQIKATENIQVLLQSEVSAVTGNERLETVTLENRATGDSAELSADAMFIFIGARPHSEIVADVVECNEAGFILTGPELYRNGKWPKSWRLTRDPLLMETSVPGIFAAGDVRHNVVRRVASAVGQGSVVVSSVHQYLKTV
jgi:thioredoxin reductase (NADPH)